MDTTHTAPKFDTLPTNLRGLQDVEISRMFFVRVVRRDGKTKRGARAIQEAAHFVCTGRRFGRLPASLLPLLSTLDGQRD
jgi:hypothetical protein